MRAPLLCLPFAFALLACSGAPPPETIDTTESPTEPSEMAPEVAPPLISSTVQLDLDQLQGTWKTVGALKAVKVISGNRETVTYYNRKNRVVSRHTADFELLRGLDETIRVIAWSNLKMSSGTPPPETSGAYVYNCDGNRLVEFRGALGSLTPRAFTDAVVWKRSGAAPAYVEPGRSKLSQPVAR